MPPPTSVEGYIPSFPAPHPSHFSAAAPYKLNAPPHYAPTASNPFSTPQPPPPPDTLAPVLPSYLSQLSPASSPPSSLVPLPLSDLQHSSDSSLLSADVVAQLVRLQRLTRSLTPTVLRSAGMDATTLHSLSALTSHIAATQPPPPSPGHLRSSPHSPSATPPTFSSSSPMSSPRSSKQSKRRGPEDGVDVKRLKADSHASTPSYDGGFSPRRRDSDAALSSASSHSGSDTDDASPSSPRDGHSSSHSPHRPSSSSRPSDAKPRDLQRKRQHQKSDKQRRAKIKDGMEQLKALVAAHGRLDSPDQASIVSASVDLVHSLRQEIAALKSDLDRARGDAQAARGGRSGLDGMRGQSMGGGGLGQLGQLTQLSQLNSQLASLQGHGLQGLNTLHPLVLSALGLPGGLGGGGGGTGLSPMAGVPMTSPPPLMMPTSGGSGSFANGLLSTSPLASNVMGGYGKEWGA